MSTKQKRRIERVTCRVNHSIGSSANYITLHAAEDRKTLIRMVAHLKIYTVADKPLGETWEAVIISSPAGSNVVSPSLGSTEDLDNPTPLQELLRANGIVFLRASS